MKVYNVQNSFTRGELSPRLLGRVDLEQYVNGCVELENFIPLPHGGLTRRGGTYYVATSKTSGKKIRLVPFEYSTTQAYMLEFGEYYIRVYKDQAVVPIKSGSITAASNANPCQITIASHPFVTGDVVYISGVGGMTQLNGNPYTVTKTGTNAFTIGVDSTGYGTYTSGGTASTEIITTYTEAELDELQFAQSVDSLYIAHPSHAPAKLVATNDTGWTLSTITFTAAPGSWTGTNYPSCVTFFEQRLVWAATPTAPQTLWFSKSGAYTDLTTGTGDSDGMTYTIASDQVNAIRWLSSGRALVIGTSGGEFVCSASSVTEALTPTNVRISRQTINGSAYDMPKMAVNVTLFIQRAQRKVLSFSYVLTEDAWDAVDLTLLSEHITAGGIKQLAYQQEPDSIVWMVRTDGQLVGMTYKKDQQVFGWHRHILGGVSDSDGNPAIVESIAVIPNDTGNELWLSVKRYVNSATVRHIEVLQPGLSEDDEVADSYFVDAGLESDGLSVITSIASGLDHLEGETVAVLGDGAYQGERVVTSGTLAVDPPATKVKVGYNYTSFMKAIPIEAGSADGPALGKTKRVSEVGLKLYKTVGCKAGFDSNLDIIPFRDSSMDMDTAVPLFTGNKFIPFTGGYNEDISVEVQQDQPLPLTLLAIMARVKTNN